MKYIKVSNLGELDIVKACSMLGASVKDNSSEAIGMFGTGLKYALAQAGRMGISIRMSSGSDVFETVLIGDTFRGVEFSKVHLRNINTGEVHVTPITTNFGQHDWDDAWFIYREIVCNAKDEDGYSLSLVNNLRRSKGRTAIYLPHGAFAEYYDNDKNYFADNRSDFIRKGTGIVYKKSVRVGEIKGLRLDIQGDINISESRQMCDWSARWKVGNMISSCMDADVWTEFLQSKEFERYDVACHSEDICKVFAKALKRIKGKFLVCPNVENIVKDIFAMGYYPFVIPTNWKMAEEYLPSWKDRMSVPEEVIRDPNLKEQKIIDWGLNCCREFGMSTDVNIKVFDDQDKILGWASMKDNSIWLAASVFDNRREFLMTIIEEVGHNDSGAADYTREFTNFFIGKIADHYIIHLY